MFNINDVIKHPRRGKGMVSAIDHANESLFYFVKFFDGTMVWLPRKETEKLCIKVDRES